MRQIRFVILGLIFALLCQENSFAQFPSADPELMNSAEIEERTNALTSIAESLQDGSFTTECCSFGSLERHGPVYVAARDSGKLVTEVWFSSGGSWEKNLRDALAKVRKSIIGGKVAATVRHYEVVLGHAFRDVSNSQRRRRFSDIHRGVSGLEVAGSGWKEFISPTQMIASNRDFRQAVQHVLTIRGNDSRDDDIDKLKLREFIAEQYLIFMLPNQVAVQQMFRGNQVVSNEDVTQKSVHQLQALLADWLLSQVHEDGRVTYRYFPSTGEESSANNMIRQFMASVALARLAVSQNNDELFQKSLANLNYNFTHFYKEDGQGSGYIEFENKAKLGAAALAALSIAEHPKADAFREHQAKLERTILNLRNDDGSFRTFLLPPDRNDNQNFYPGEALLYLATRFVDTKDPDLFAKIIKSVEFYQGWHAEHRNPAFVPWHTQAYYLLWRETKDEKLATYILKMNDWLLSIQQWRSVPYRDLQGRFYDPLRPYFGPPHASSTGVYLEGLIDAFSLARELGDSRREELYRRAIIRGLRSVMQLVFADEIDMYYTSKPEMVRGGVRTAVYDNSIRVDNVQHNLMALLKILKVFSENDYSFTQPVLLPQQPVMENSVSQ